MLTKNETIKQLEKLSSLERFIFHFYWTELDTLEVSGHTIGCPFHLEFLLKNAPKSRPTLFQDLKQIPRQTFRSKAQKMVNLAKACAELSK